MAAPNNLESAYGVTNIKSHIATILDIGEHNYDPWCELMLTHCLSFDVLDHLNGTILHASDNDLTWKKCDGLVKLWIYGTVSKEVFKSCFKTDATTRDIWTVIEDLFRGNKKSRAIQLDNDLRTKEIGDKDVHTYSQEIKTLANLLANVGSPVSDRTMVTYMLNDLTEKFDNIPNVIKPRNTFPTFAEACQMLISEEDRLSKIKKPNLSYTDTSSSNTILAVQHHHPANNSKSLANFRTAQQ